MTYVIIILIVLVAVISTVVSEGGFLSKLSLSAIIAAVAFMLIKWITGWTIMALFAKICGAVAILVALVAIIRKIAE